MLQMVTSATLNNNNFSSTGLGIIHSFEAGRVLKEVGLVFMGRDRWFWSFNQCIMLAESLNKEGGRNW